MNKHLLLSYYKNPDDANPSLEVALQTFSARTMEWSADEFVIRNEWALKDWSHWNNLLTELDDALYFGEVTFLAVEQMWRVRDLEKLSWFVSAIDGYNTEFNDGTVVATAEVETKRR